MDLVETLVRVNSEQTALIRRLEEELARLKKLTPFGPRDGGGTGTTGEETGPGEEGGSTGRSLKGRPRQDCSSEQERREGEPPRKWAKAPRGAIPVDREATLFLPPLDLPADAQFTGFKARIFQDLRLVRDNTRFRCAQWHSPSTGKSYLAPLPPGYQGHFGPGLAVLAPTLVYSTNLSQRDLLRLCWEYGLKISAGTISNKVTVGMEWVRSDFEAAVRAAWEAAPFRSTDHTQTAVAGVPHTTQVFDDPLCTVFCTLPGANRAAVIQGLRLGRPHEYRLDEVALKLMEPCQLSRRLRRRLAAISAWPATPDGFEHHLDRCCPALSVEQRETVLTACALAATLAAPPFPLPKRLLTDAASVFNILILLAERALCWVHEGRHYQELNPTFTHYRRALKRFRRRFWAYYRRLLAYRRAPDPATAQQLEADFDKLFATKTGYGERAHCMTQTRSRKAKLLLVLKYPELPLHTNATELMVRKRVRRRDVSFGPQSQAGLRAWDLMQSLGATLGKHGLTVREFLHDRTLALGNIPPLAEVIRGTAPRLEASSWATGVPSGPWGAGVPSPRPGEALHHPGCWDRLVVEPGSAPILPSRKPSGPAGHGHGIEIQGAGVLRKPPESSAQGPGPAGHWATNAGAFER
jgi:hypothetical protein